MANIDKSATTKKAMPVQNRSPVMKYTTRATIIAGINTKNNLIMTITIKPTTTRTISRGTLSQPSPKLLRIEKIAVRKTRINII